jgi:hypothetical protein
MGVASWRAGSSLPLRYRNGLSGRERREADKASSTCMRLAVNAIDGRDGEQVHLPLLPRGLAGSFETAQMDHLYGVKSIWQSGAAPFALCVKYSR